MKKQPLGFALIVVGVGLLLWGYNISGGLEAKVTKFVTGSPTDKVMWLYIGGAACAVLGALLAFGRK